jgi:nicotinate-nucleotide adenylyltransferase
VKKVGLYFGTFNPVHNGHLELGNYFLKHTDLDQVRFIVSPQNPFKKDQELLADHHRLEMVRLALEGIPDLLCSDIEFSLPKPSFTINTLKYLKKNEPNVEFVLLMGEDNLVTFNQWNAYQTILSLVDLYVYPRNHKGEIPQALASLTNIHLVPAPKLDFASQDIRRILRKGGSVKSSVPGPSLVYLKNNRFYQ